MPTLTDQSLKAQKAPKTGRLELTDARSQGLVFRVTDKGHRSFSFRFRCPITGRVSRFTIGDYPDMTLANARRRADELRVQVANGLNPSDERKRERETRATKAFGAVSDRYLKEWAERQKAASSTDKDRRALDKHILPKWRFKNIASLRRSDISELCEGIVSAGTPVQANRVQALISKIFSFAVDKGILDANPCRGMQRAGGAEAAATRYLLDPEIAAFWKGCGLPPMQAGTGLALKLALLTGVRCSEAAGMAKSELRNIETAGLAFWELPGSRTKNRNTHVVPLPEMARQLVLAALAIAPKASPYVFPSPVIQGQPIQGHSLTVAMQRMASVIEGGAAATWKADPPSPHDLRRTFRTKLSALAVPVDVRDRLMNHAKKGVGQRHYDQYDFMDEKRGALARWCDHVNAIVGGGL